MHLPFSLRHSIGSASFSNRPERIASRTSRTASAPLMTAGVIMAVLLTLFLTTPAWTVASADAPAKPPFIRNFDTLMEIGGIKALTASETHFYILSEREGLIVFRAHSDSLQWLYSSSGLANRGDNLVTDIRFSYLFGKDRRLTVIEPTSVLGVYSSTRLDTDPSDVVRIENDLFLAGLGNGVKRLSVETPESLDRKPDLVFPHQETIVALARIGRQLFALDASNRLFHFEYEDGDITLMAEHRMPRGTRHLYVDGTRLYAASTLGDIYRIRPDGRADGLFSIDEPVTHFLRWKNNYFIRGGSNRIWVTRQGVRPTLFRDDADAGNYMVVVKDQLWISEYQQLGQWQQTDDYTSRVLRSPDATDRPAPHDTRHDDHPDDRKPGSGDTLRLAPIDDQIIPFPRPLIIAFRLESGHHLQDIRFQQRSRIDGIQIRGNSMYWRPSTSDVGNHIISIIASSRDGQTDSTSFQVTVRQFNSPPRFTPVRTLSIALDEEFSIPIRAHDPDGSGNGLIRYIGVDLPDGSSLNERTGLFRWTPARRQAGTHEFQVIATDQYGAAASLDVRINVLDLRRDGSE